MVQLVAQKLTKVTLPFIASVVYWLPSNSTMVDAGARPVESAVSLQADRAIPIAKQVEIRAR